jgi:hypothetical protein
MATAAFRKALPATEELTITVTGRTSGRKIALPVWFVEDGKTLYLLPVKGSESEWYQNVLRTPTMRLAAKRASITVRAKPIKDAEMVRKVVEQFRAKYGARDVKRYYSKFDVCIAVRLPS